MLAKPHTFRLTRLERVNRQVVFALKLLYLTARLKFLQLKNSGNSKGNNIINIL